MNIAFRVDASQQIGTGHLMRCLTLGDTLRSRGVRTRYVCRGLSSSLTRLVEQSPHEHILLGVAKTSVPHDDLAHSGWLRTSQAEDAADTTRALADRRWDWLVVDHYALDKRWESAMRCSTAKVMVIDDLADRHHDCDVLLDQNLYANMQTRYTEKVPAHCRVLLGPNYSLLRREFRQWRQRTNYRNGPVNRILVFLGGMDADNFTAVAVRALAELQSAPLHVDVVIGVGHPFRTEIETACAENGFQCHVQTARMAELMAAADLAIGAGGSASWERCCVGLPSIVVALADNQLEIAKGLDRFGGCIFIGEGESVSVERLKVELQRLVTSEDRVAELSQQSFTLVDGLGSQKVSQLLCSEYENLGPVY